MRGIGRLAKRRGFLPPGRAGLDGDETEESVIIIGVVGDWVLYDQQGDTRTKRRRLNELLEAKA